MNWIVPAGAAIAHDSAARHVSGEALYIDDLPEPPGLLHAHIKLSEHAHAKITRLDVSAVASAPGVVAVMTAADIPGVNDVGPAFPGDPIFADGLVEYHGQSLFAVAAGSIALAREAAGKAVVEYDVLPPILTIDEALAAKSTVLPTQIMSRGDAQSALERAPLRLSGRIDIGGQEHFYLEGQVAMAIPGEGGDMLVHSSTQHPTEVQHLVARTLKLSDHAVICETRRMGGGFGGKESQASLIACVAALLAQRTKRPVKLRLDRDDDMVLTGKRHEFRIDYEAGFDAEGRILGISFMQAGRCGFSPDLSGAICDRAMFHADNCYYLDHAHIVSYRCKTNTVSNTAFRGFGGPQGMMGIECAIDDIARSLGLDPLLVRQRNFYGTTDRNITPYRMTVEDNIIPELVAELAETAEYARRRVQIAAFNAENPWVKRGLALTPVKFGISFTLTHMNQAGALVHVYTDGSVMLNHGGTEMGQGLYTKVAQVVASEFGLNVDRVKITATSTAKVPNTSPTAASSGSDLNGKAAQAAAVTIRERMAEVAAKEFGVAAVEVSFVDGMVLGGDGALTFAEVAKLTHRARVQLSATGYYATPKLHYDSATHQGRPFFYFAYGAAVAEVEIDTLTGEYRLRRADILHDCGQSLNPALDIGQIEGGFVQGMGWLTTEELWWDADGRLRTHAPSTYKIPTCGDIPAEFNVSIYAAGRNAEDAIYRSKAVGEPPLMLGIAVFHALKDAVAAVSADGTVPRFDAPATPERILNAVMAMRTGAAQATVPTAGVRGSWIQALTELERNGEAAVLVTVVAARGSTPREAGCKMVVTETNQFDTIGGGNLEFTCVAAARSLLTKATRPVLRDFPLGPALAQCCGGHVSVLFEPLRPILLHVAVFGAGHVGRALVGLLSGLRIRVTWFDTRAELLANPPLSVGTCMSGNPAEAVSSLPGGALVLVMTQDHQIDFDIVAAALRRNDFIAVGLIGSETKRARFSRRLARAGVTQDAISRLICPIGLPGVGGKLPAEVAISVAAQILQIQQRVAEENVAPMPVHTVQMSGDCGDCLGDCAQLAVRG